MTITGLQNHEASIPDRSSLVELAAEVVASYVARHAVPPAEMPVLIETVHGALANLVAPESGVPTRPLRPAISVRKSVTDTHVVSLEDGKPYKTLTRHLAKLGMTPAEYRTKWNLPANYPVVAPAYTRARSAQAKSMGLGSRLRKRP